MTDFDKPYDLRDFKMEVIYPHQPVCILCKTTQSTMIKVSMVTAQDGIESSHSPNYVCMYCVVKLSNLIRKGWEKEE